MHKKLFIAAILLVLLVSACARDSKTLPKKKPEPQEMTAEEQILAYLKDKRGYSTDDLERVRDAVKRCDMVYLCVEQELGTRVVIDIEQAISILGLPTEFTGPRDPPTADDGAPPDLSCTYFDEDFKKFDFNIVKVDAQETDPNINLNPGKHFIYVPSDRPEREELVVYLPGTAQGGGGSVSLLQASAFAGYKTIGLRYENLISIGMDCLEAPDRDQCVEDLRKEKLYGTDTSDLVDIDRANSIENRLLKLLQWANQQAPQYNWDEYYNGDKLNYDKMIFMGWSQGGGFSYMLAQDHVVAKAITISNTGDMIVDPNDIEGTIRLVDWMKEPFKTPPERLYAFYNSHEWYTYIWPETMEVLDLDKFGSIKVIQEEEPPYGCSHVLASDFVYEGSEDLFERAHKSLVSEKRIPKDENGIAEFMPVYIYLLTAKSN